MKLSLLFFYLALIYLACLVFFVWISDRLIFLPPKSSYIDSAHIIKIKTNANETISAVFLKSSNASYTLLVSHGNAEDIGHLMPLLKSFQAQGLNVLAYDYPSYGTSTGRATEKSVYRAEQAAYDYLTSERHIAPAHIVLYGRSIGAAVALDLAVQKPIAGLIMESAFVSVFRVVTRLPLFPFDPFNNLRKIKKIHCPVLFIHGTADTIVPFWHAKKLYAAAPKPKQHFWVNGANHNNVLWIAKDKYWRMFNEFIRSLSIS